MMNHLVFPLRCLYNSLFLLNRCYFNVMVVLFSLIMTGRKKVCCSRQLQTQVEAQKLENIEVQYVYMYMSLKRSLLCVIIFSVIFKVKCNMYKAASSRPSDGFNVSTFQTTWQKNIYRNVINIFPFNLSIQTTSLDIQFIQTIDFFLLCFQWLQHH